MLLISPFEAIFLWLLGEGESGLERKGGLGRKHFWMGERVDLVIVRNLGVV